MIKIEGDNKGNRSKYDEGEKRYGQKICSIDIFFFEAEKGAQNNAGRPTNKGGGDKSCRCQKVTDL